jgi:hypothetical protein
VASLTDTEIETLVPIVELQAKRVAARYEGTEADDLAQDVWVWIAEESSPALRDYIATGHIGRLAKSVYNAAVNKCEKDRKAALRELGIDWRDDYNYSRPEVARLLPVALDPESIPGCRAENCTMAPRLNLTPLMAEVCWLHSLTFDPRTLSCPTQISSTS